tara:strand:+ start:165 stop:680 length:516 start_codon:yes stop_codon:yes gene_type:complete
MKKVILLFLIIILQNCSKPKTVMICGDHKCVNKDEARQYFEENLSIEVKIIDSKNKINSDLVELNLNTNSKKKEINIFSKKKTKQEIKILTDNEIKIIKQNIKSNNKKKKITKRGNIIINPKNKNIDKKNNSQNKIVDICTIIKKCSIDEISKFLIKDGMSRKFPDITLRE